MNKDYGFHLERNVYFLRTDDGVQVTVVNGEKYDNPVIKQFTVPFEAFASVMASMSYRGEDFHTWRVALDFLRKGSAELGAFAKAAINDEFPRRARVDINTPAELAIREAAHRVEEVGASEKLTRAVILLEEARNLVADHLEGK